MAALQWHYRILQALALDEDHPGTPDDKTKPRYRQIDKVSPFASQILQGIANSTSARR